MKNISQFIIFISITFSAFVSSAQNPFIGTWQLKSGEYINHQGELIDYKTLGLEAQKVLSEKDFSFVTVENGKFWAAGTGSYEYTGEYYTETPLYASYTLPNKEAYKFKYTLEGDLWINERWEKNQRVEYEIWQRVSK